jgi:hypothetical protein
VEEQLDIREAEALAKENGALFCVVSARDKSSVDLAFLRLVEAMVRLRESLAPQPQQPAVGLKAAQPQGQGPARGRGGCCA